MNSIVQTLLSSIASAASNTQVANVIGQHLQSQANTKTSIQALVGLATPANAQQIAGQIAALPGVPATVTPLLNELSQARDQNTITAIGLQIEAALNANSGVLGSILSAL